jgi:hypothetical protein
METLMKVSVEVPSVGTVEFSADLHDFETDNDGIGNYEYWGAKCYDRGEDYLVLEEALWNKGLFSEEQNKTISDYLDETAGEDNCIFQKLCDLASEVWDEWQDVMEEASFDIDNM